MGRSTDWGRDRCRVGEGARVCLGGVTGWGGLGSGGAGLDCQRGAWGLSTALPLMMLSKRGFSRLAPWTFR